MAGTSYTRQSTLTDGDTITAGLFNAEYNQLVTAFSYSATGTNGHQHDGGAGEGGNIEIIGDQDFKNKIVVDTSNNRWSVFVEVGGSAVEQVRIEDGVVYPVTDSDVDLGTDALRFKNAYIDSLTATGNLTVGGNITVTGNVDVDGIVEFDGLSGTGAVTVTNILDEDNMASDSATALVTQQSVKAYVDAQQDTVDTFGEVLALSNTTAGTDISVSTDDKVQFRDAAIYINSSADGQLDIVADTEIQIAATTIDINGAVALSGAVTGATNITLSGELDAATGDFSGAVDIDGALDVAGTTNLDVVDIDGAVDMATTLAVAGNVDFNGDLDVDGTTNLDVVDIDGAVDMASTLTVASNIVVGGTVDGRDVAADGTKLDGIEASADVTDTANVTAAGALMDSELTAIASVKALNQGVATGDSPTFVNVTATSLDISGNIDVDGTTNLDVVDIDGAVDMASTLAVAGVVTANAGVVVDNFTLDGTTLALSAGDFTLDVVGDIILDADGDDIKFKEAGNEWLKIRSGSTGPQFRSTVSDHDITFRGNDGGSEITALTLDMSEAGAATFNAGATFTGEITANAGIALPDNQKATFGDGGDLELFYNGTHSVFKDGSAGNIYIQDDNNIVLGSIGGENYLVATKDAAVTLYYDADAKLATTATGIDVTGRAIVDGLSSSASIIGTSNSNSLGGTTFTSAISTVGLSSTAAITSTSNSNSLGGTSFTSSIDVTGTINGVGINVIETGSILVSNDGGTGTISSALRNTGLGFEVFDDLTSGDDNTGIGRKALTKLTTGGGNTATGSGSLTAHTTGDSNTAFGVSALASNTTASNNTAVGSSALLANTTASNNTAVGKSALLSNTTGAQNTAVGQAAGDALTVGSYNVALGQNALSSDTQGSQSVAIGSSALFTQNFTSATAANNTAVGHGAGAAVTTGTRNTLIGGLAGDASTTANYNTALGYTALGANTTGDLNTAIGDNALATNTTATGNTAVGQGSLQLNTTGANNVAVGYTALDANTTASNNTAVGKSALGANTTGDNNVAVGHSSLSGCTTGSQNTAIGQNSLLACTTGGYNIAVGHQAAAWAAGLVTGSFNIHLGYATKTAATDTSNELVIATGNDGSTGKGNNTGWFDNLTSGIYQVNNSASWATTSDERLKKNIVDNNTGLSILNQLQVKNFEHRIESEITELSPEQRIKGEGIQIGVIAQEVQQILPECVTELETGVLTVDTSNLTWYLINAVKELSAQVDALTARLETLEG